MTNRIPTDASEQALIVLLHGSGSSSRCWDRLISLWRMQLPHAIFSTPDAPYPCERGGFGWFEQDLEGGGDLKRNVIASRTAFDGMFARVLTAHQFEKRLNNVSLVGFSQGATVTLDVLARGGWPVGAAICFAGRLPPTDLAVPSRETALLLVHGDRDPVVPEQEGRRIATAFERHGVRVERHVVEANGHGISRRAAEIGGMFLRENLAESRFDLADW